MAPLRVLISGAGVAGPALAFWMTRLGHRCSIIERFPSLRANGQQIDIREQAVDVARRMGLLEEIRKHVVDESGLRFVDSDGKQKALFPKVESKDGRHQGFTSEFEIMRGDLCRIMVDAAAAQTKYRFGLSVDELENGKDGVEVRLSDGSVETYDLLVAADGQGSRIRKMMLRDDEAAREASHSLGVYVAYYTLARTPEDDNLATVFVAPGRRVAATRWHSAHQGQAYLATMAHADEMEAALRQDVDRQKDLFARVFKGTGWQSNRLVEELRTADDFYAQAIVQIKCAPWSKGRVVLLGDAGYCPSPLTGMGTSLALIGAYVLAGEIARSDGDLESALAAYDRALRPLVDRIQKLPRGVPGLVYPKTELGVKALQLILALAEKLRLTKLLESRTLPAREGWTLPDYPQLGY
ncbi:hypothetical protein CDD83_313 [Cordyceps sp. RAO-2017]|nr:hypothetical protein CDD83_313 [Cordyceps sp. RAO-2017]